MRFRPGFATSASRSLRLWHATLMTLVLLVTAGCGGSSDSGSGSRFDETSIAFRNLGSDIECSGTIVERGPNADGSTFARCTWACGINGPRKAGRHFYVREWRRQPGKDYRFHSEQVENSICR